MPPTAARGCPDISGPESCRAVGIGAAGDAESLGGRAERFARSVAGGQVECRFGTADIGLGIRLALRILAAFSVRQDIIPLPARMVAIPFETVRAHALDNDFLHGNRQDRDCALPERSHSSCASRGRRAGKYRDKGGYRSFSGSFLRNAPRRRPAEPSERESR